MHCNEEQHLNQDRYSSNSYSNFVDHSGKIVDRFEFITDDVKPSNSNLAKNRKEIRISKCKDPVINLTNLTLRINNPSCDECCGKLANNGTYERTIEVLDNETGKCVFVRVKVARYKCCHCCYKNTYTQDITPCNQTYAYQVRKSKDAMKDTSLRRGTRQKPKIIKVETASNIVCPCCHTQIDSYTNKGYYNKDILVFFDRLNEVLQRKIQLPRMQCPSCRKTFIYQTNGEYIPYLKLKVDDYSLVCRYLLKHNLEAISPNLQEEEKSILQASLDLTAEEEERAAFINSFITNGKSLKRRGLMCHYLSLTFLLGYFNYRFLEPLFYHFIERSQKPRNPHWYMAPFTSLIALVNHCLPNIVPCITTHAEGIKGGFRTIIKHIKSWYRNKNKDEGLSSFSRDVIFKHFLPA